MALILRTRFRTLCKLYGRMLSAQSADDNIWETDIPRNYDPWDYPNDPDKAQKEPDSSREITGQSRHHTDATELSFMYTNRPSAGVNSIFGSDMKHLSSANAKEFSSGLEKFSDFISLNPTLIERLEEVGYAKPTQIQKQSLVAALNGKHCVIKSLTGGGKTLAFLVPALNKIIMTEPQPVPQVIIVAPTRELCSQIVKQIELLIGPERVQNFIGGGDKVRAQSKQIRAKVRKNIPASLNKLPYRDIIVATPGRVRQSLSMNLIQPDNIKYLILDEADQLLDDQFYNNVRLMLDHSNDQKQIFITTATIPKEIQSVIDRYMKHHEYIDTGDAQYTIPNTINHQVYIYNRGSKHKCLEYVLKQYHKTQTMLFMKYAVKCEDLADDLRMLGYKVKHIYSAMPAANREKVVKSFRKGEFEILVTTDIMARGVDVPNCDLVIHNNPVFDVDKFVHRSGRTGRQGRAGTSVLILPNPKGGKNLSKTNDNYKLFLQDLSALAKFEYTHFDKSFVKKMGVK